MRPERFYPIIIQIDYLATKRNYDKSLMLDVIRAGGGIVARQRVGASRQLTVTSRPAIVARTLVATLRDWHAWRHTVEDRKVADRETVGVRRRFDVVTRAVTAASVLVTVVNWNKRYQK